MPSRCMKADVRELITLCTLNNFMENDSNDQEEEDNLAALAIIESHRYSSNRPTKPIPTAEPFWKGALFSVEYSEQLFRTYFRMTRSAFWSLCQEISVTGEFTDYQEAIPLQLAVGLYRLGMYGNAASILQIANKFCLSEGTVWTYTDRVIKSLIKLSPKLIYWPTVNERRRIGDEMARKMLPKCIGFVDGTDVIFSQAPVDNKEVYWSRKKQYCLQVQIVCDPYKQIRDLFTGYPGSVHDAKVYSSCPLGVAPEKYFSDGEFIVGDSAYALTETVIVPFRRSTAGISSQQKKFNRHVSSERVKVEHTIGILKGRFKSLTDLRIMVTGESGHKRACEWVQACAVLHNFLMINEDWIDSEEIFEEQDDVEEINVEVSKKGHFKRQALFEIFRIMSN